MRPQNRAITRNEWLCTHYSHSQLINVNSISISVVVGRDFFTLFVNNIHRMMHFPRLIASEIEVFVYFENARPKAISLSWLSAAIIHWYRWSLGIDQASQIQICCYLRLQFLLSLAAYSSGKEISHQSWLFATIIPS